MIAAGLKRGSHADRILYDGIPTCDSLSRNSPAGIATELEADDDIACVA